MLDDRLAPVEIEIDVEDPRQTVKGAGDMPYAGATGHASDAQSGPNRLSCF
jgi:hypothetical protein